jgi:hypothetical protein
VAVGSANLSYHFLSGTKDRKLEPFVTAGYTLFFRAGTSTGVNLGGGVNVWLTEHAALRLEVRDNAAKGWVSGRFWGEEPRISSASASA